MPQLVANVEPIDTFQTFRNRFNESLTYTNRVQSGNNTIFVDANGLYVNVASLNIPIDFVASLNDLTDVTISSPIDGEVLTYNSLTSQWNSLPVNIDLTTAERVDEEFEAILDQKVFTLQQGTFTPGSIDVYVDGVHAPSSSYTEDPNGLFITFANTGLPAGANVVITGYKIQTALQAAVIGRVYQSNTVTQEGQTLFVMTTGTLYEDAVEVYYNGVHLASNEYTANTTSVTLNVGASNNSIVEIISYELTALGGLGDVSDAEFTNLGPGDVIIRNQFNTRWVNTPAGAEESVLQIVNGLPKFSDLNKAQRKVYQSNTASEGQTTFTIDGGYDVGQIDIFVNGAHLANTEYVENGSTVILNEALANNDVFEISAYNFKTFPLRTAIDRVYQSDTASNNQTTFTITGGYDVDNIDVFINGVKLANTEYAQNGSTIVLNQGAANNDIVDFLGYRLLQSNLHKIGGSKVTKLYQANTVTNTPVGGQYVFDIDGGILNTDALDIFINGVILQKDVDYVGYPANGSIVLTTPASNNDLFIASGWNLTSISAANGIIFTETGINVHISDGTIIANTSGIAVDSDVLATKPSFISAIEGLGFPSYTGDLAANQITFWANTTAVTGNNNFTWDNTNSKLSVDGTFEINSNVSGNTILITSSGLGDKLRIHNASATNTPSFLVIANGQVAFGTDFSKGLNSNTTSEVLSSPLFTIDVSPTHVSTGVEDLTASDFRVVTRRDDNKHGPEIDIIKHKSTAGINNGLLGRLRFIGPNSDRKNKTFASIETTSKTASVGVENGLIDFKVLNGGVFQSALKIDSGGVNIGSPNVLAQPRELVVQDDIWSEQEIYSVPTSGTVPKIAGTGDATHTGVFLEKEGTINAAANQSGDGTGYSAILNVNNRSGTFYYLDFRVNGTSQGSVYTTDGSTITYSPFLGSHLSLLDDNSRDDIPVGTIVETIEKLAVWKVAKFTLENGETRRICYNGQTEVGSTTYINFEEKSYLATIETDWRENAPDLNKHVCFKVNDKAGSTSVFGVFLGWDETPETNTDAIMGLWNEASIAAVGNYFIRIASEETVQIGDLIEADGNGCGRVQDDTIIRSSTVGKVTSTFKQKVYDDGSYLVTAVLYCG